MFDYLFGPSLFPGYTVTTPPAPAGEQLPVFQTTTDCADVRLWIVGAFALGLVVMWAAKK